MLKWEKPALQSLSLKGQVHGNGADCHEGSGNIHFCNPGGRAGQKCIDGSGAFGQGCGVGNGQDLR